MRVDLARDADVAALVRSTDGESLVVVIGADRDAVLLAQAQAAIGPLAAAVAPCRRVNAVVVGASATADSVAAIVAFLESASSTTGQVVSVS